MPKRQRPSVGVTAALAAAEVLLVSLSAVAVTAATADPPRWPEFLEGAPLTPFSGMIVSIIATMLLAVAIAIHQLRREPVGSAETTMLAQPRGSANGAEEITLHARDALPATTKRAWLVVEHYIDVERGEATRIVVVPLPVEPARKSSEGRDVR